MPNVFRRLVTWLRDLIDPSERPAIQPAEPRDDGPAPAPVLDPLQRELEARIQNAREAQEEVDRKLKEVRELNRMRRLQHLSDPALHRDQLMQRLLRLREMQELMELNNERQRLEEETAKLKEKNLIQL